MKNLILILSILILGCSNDSILELPEPLLFQQKMFEDSEVWDMVQSANTKLNVRQNISDPFELFVYSSFQGCYGSGNIIDFVDTSVLRQNTDTLKMIKVYPKIPGRYEEYTLTEENNVVKFQVDQFNGTGQTGTYSFNFVPSQLSLTDINICPE